MDAEDLVAMYAAQAKASMEEEANKRLEASLDPEEEERLRNLPLSDAAGTPHFVPALLARLGTVRAALDGHGGGIKVTQHEVTSEGLDLVLDLDWSVRFLWRRSGNAAGHQGRPRSRS